MGAKIVKDIWVIQSKFISKQINKFLSKQVKYKSMTHKMHWITTKFNNIRKF